MLFLPWLLVTLLSLILLEVLFPIPDDLIIDILELVCLFDCLIEGGWWNYPSSNNNKANNKHKIRMLVLHSSNGIEIHKGGRIGHSSKDVPTILIVLMQMLRVML